MAAPMADMSSPEKTPKSDKRTQKKKKQSQTDASKRQKTDDHFTEIEFKLLLREDKTCFALEKFTEECDKCAAGDGYDIVVHYLRTSPQCDEILPLLARRNRKPAEIAQIFTVLEKILLRVADDLRRHESTGIGVVRQILSAHLGNVYYLLAMRNKSTHIKAALKLLVAMVMQGEMAAREVQIQFDFQKDLLPPLLNRRNRLDLYDVRACYIQFLVAFLLAGDRSTICRVLEMKGLLNGIFPGLSNDKVTTLRILLPTLRDKIVLNATIPKTMKIRLFNEVGLKHLAELYKWSAEQEKSELEEPDAEESEESQEVRDMTHQLLLDLCTNQKTGITFWDKSCATSNKNQNHVLTKLLTTVSQANQCRRQSELVCSILELCPDQIHWYMPSLHTSLSPRPSVKWIQWMDFVCQIYKKQREVDVSKATQQSIAVNKMVAIVMNQLFPPKDIWTAISSALKKDSIVLRHYAGKVLLVIIQRVAATLVHCKAHTDTLTTDFYTTLYDSIVKYLPSLDVFYQCWRSALKRQNTEKSSDSKQDVNVPFTEHLQLILEVLCSLLDALPLLFREQPVDYNMLLEGVREARQIVELSGSPDESLSLLQLHLLKLLVHSDLSQFNWTKQSVGSRTTLYLLLEMVVMTQAHADTHRTVTKLVSQSLVRTGYFHGVEHELLWWLESLSDTEQVLNLVEAALLQLLRRPYHYLDAVKNAVTVVTTKQADVKAGWTIQDEDDSSNDHIGQLFSPLVPAILTVTDKLENVDPDILTYIQKVLLTILHHQGNPAILCHMISEHALYRSLASLHSAVNRWGIDPPKQPKKKKAEIEDLPLNTEASTTDYLMACFTRGDIGIQKMVVDRLSIVSLSDTVNLSTQILLYLHTASNEYIQKVAESNKPVKCYAHILGAVVDAALTYYLKSDDSNEKSKIHDSSMNDALKDIFTRIFRDNMLRRYFLPKDLTCKRTTKVSNIIGSTVAKLAAKVPASLELTSLFEPYVKQISQCLLSQKYKVTTELLGTMAEFSPRIEPLKLHKLTLRLLESDVVQECFEDENSSDNHRNLIHILSSALQHSHQSTHRFEVIQKLAQLVAMSNNEALLSLFASVLCKTPSCTMALDQATFLKLLELHNPTLDPLMKVSLMTNSCCRGWFLQWLEQTKYMKKKQGKWKVASYVSYYLQGCSESEDVSRFVACYWSDISEYLVEGDDDKDTTVIINLARFLIHLIDDKEMLETVANGIPQTTPNTTDVSHLSNQVSALGYLLDRLVTLGGCPESRYIESVFYGVHALATMLGEKGNKHKDMSKTVALVLSWCQNIPSDCVMDIPGEWFKFLTCGLKKMYGDVDFFQLLINLVNRCYERSLTDDDYPFDERCITVRDIHAWVWSHSLILHTLLPEKPTPQRDALVELLLTLIDLEPFSCDTIHLTIILGAYGATLSLTDQRVLLLLSKYEAAGCDLTSYRPYMWGRAAVEHYATKMNLGSSLYKSPTMCQVLDQLDKDKLQQCVLMFPLFRKTQVTIQNEKDLRSDLDLYDPCFLLPMFCHLLASENVVDHQKFVDHNCFSYVLAALSSNDETIRATAYLVLARYHHHLEGHSKFREKHQITYIMDTIRNSAGGPNAKLPCVMSQFLSRAALLMLQPECHMYQMINSFLLLKPAVDLGHVPEFYVLFNSSAHEYKVERSWMLSLLSEGLREKEDYRIYNRRHVIKLVLSFYHSDTCDQGSQMEILRLVKRACSIRPVAVDLVKQHGLIPWLEQAQRDGVMDVSRCCHIVDIIHTVWLTLLGDEDSTDEHYVHQLPTNQIILACFDLLHTVKVMPSTTYLQLLSCMVSMCRHNNKLSRRASSHPGTSQHVSIHLSHITALLRHWAGLSLDGTLRDKLDTLQRGNCISGGNSVLKTTRRSGDDHVKIQCVRCLLELVSHCTPEKDHSSVDAIITVVNWSLSQLDQGQSVSVVGKVLLWLWACLQSNNHLHAKVGENSVVFGHLTHQLLAVYDGTLQAEMALLDGNNSSETDHEASKEIETMDIDEPEDDAKASSEQTSDAKDKDIIRKAALKTIPEEDSKSVDYKYMLRTFNQIMQFLLGKLSSGYLNQSEVSLELKKRLDKKTSVRILELDLSKDVEADQRLAACFFVECLSGAVIPIQTKSLMSKM